MNALGFFCYDREKEKERSAHGEEQSEKNAGASQKKRNA
jgi:hypothetical protein